MQVLLDINDDKASFVLELLQNLNFVKTSLLSPYEVEVLGDLKNAVNEVNEIKSNYQKPQSLDSFLNEL